MALTVERNGSRPGREPDRGKPFTIGLNAVIKPRERS